MTDITMEGNLPVENAPKIKAPPVFSRTETITAVLMLVLGYLYIKLLINPAEAGLSIAVFTLLFIGVVLYWQRGQQLPHSRDSLVYLGLMLLTAAYFPLYDNPALKDLALLLLHLLVGYYTATISGIRLEKRLSSYLPFDLLDSLIIRPFSNLFNGPRALFSGTKNARGIRGLLLVATGVALAIPACIVVSYSLQDADAAFATLWQRIMGAFLTENIISNIMQFLISLPIACYFFGLLYGGKQPLYEREKISGLAERARFAPGLLAIGAITPLLLIYVVFFCSQTAYFLSAFSGLLPEGYIYSEYARRGFFELCQVSSLNLAIILALQLFCKKDVGKGLIFRAYTAALSLTSIALIAISLAKMLLYIQIYGLTPLRVYTSWFMILLALVFILILVKLYRQKFNIMKWSSVLAVTMFLLLCFANPDAQIARYNVGAYQDGRLEQLDVALLGELGAAATPYLLEIANSEQFGPEYQAEAQMELDIRMRTTQNKNMDWRSYNLATWQSNNRLVESAW